MMSKFDSCETSFKTFSLLNSYKTGTSDFLKIFVSIITPVYIMILRLITLLSHMAM